MTNSRGSGNIDVSVLWIDQSADGTVLAKSCELLSSTSRGCSWAETDTVSPLVHTSTPIDAQSKDRSTRKDLPMGKEKQKDSLPLVSIVVPNLNGLPFLQQLVPSLMRTDYPHFEIIVVDNGSTDRSVSFLRREYPSVLLVCLKGNRGVSAAYNAGMAVASGRFVSFLNNDMVVDPNWLLPLVQMLQAEDRAAGCDSKYLDYFRRERIDRSLGAGRFIDKYGNGVTGGAGQYDKGQFDIPREVFYGLSLFRRDLVEKAGGFDKEFFAYYEETDLCWRLHRMGYGIMYVPESRIYHIGGATSSEYRKGEKRLKNVFIFHFYKNKLRMLMKNHAGRMLWFSIIAYFVDLLGMMFIWLLTKNQLYVPMGAKAVVWNLKHIKATLKQRRTFSSFRSCELFLPYSGALRKMAFLISDKLK